MIWFEVGVQNGGLGDKHLDLSLCGEIGVRKLLSLLYMVSIGG